MLHSLEKNQHKTIEDCIWEGKAWSLGFGLPRTLYKLDKTHFKSQTQSWNCIINQNTNNNNLDRIYMEITVTKKACSQECLLQRAIPHIKKHANKLLQIIETKAAASVLDCYVPLATLVLDNKNSHSHIWARLCALFILWDIRPLHFPQRQKSYLVTYALSLLTFVNKQFWSAVFSTVWCALSKSKVQTSYRNLEISRTLELVYQPTQGITAERQRW